MKFELAQINTKPNDFKGNTHKIIAQLKKAEKHNTDVLVFPGNAISGYPLGNLVFEENYRNNINAALKAVAQASVKTRVLLSYTYLGIIYKVLLFNKKIKLLKENSFTVKGKSIAVAAGTVLLPCSADPMPSDDFLQLFDTGCEYTVVIANCHFSLGKYAERTVLLSSLAKSNNTTVLFCNSLGATEDLIFDGGSLVFDPSGDMLLKSERFEENSVVFDTKIKHRSIPPFRIYAEQEAVDAIVFGLKDFSQKTGIKKAVLGLSGGIDSALVCALAVHALGKENVTGISLPSKFTTDLSKSEAQILAKNLGIKFYELPIEHNFNSVEKSLSPVFKGTKPDVTEENMQARIRGLMLMAYANKFGAMLLATGNKSEFSMGYSTLYGDSCGALAPIGDLLKTMVYSISNYYNENIKNVIPQQTILRPPTAELRHNQKDQDSLPPYGILDIIIAMHVEQNAPLATIAKVTGKSEKFIKDIISRIAKAQFKRKQAPPVFKLNSMPFGTGFCYPIVRQM